MATGGRDPSWPYDWPGPTFTDRPTLIDLLARARHDDALMQALKDDPLGTAKQWGVGVNSDAVKIWLGYSPDTISDEQLLDRLQQLLNGKRCSA